MSYLVHRKGLQTNTITSANSPALSIQEHKDFWEQVGKELIELDEIIKDEPKEIAPILQFAQKRLQKGMG